MNEETEEEREKKFKCYNRLILFTSIRHYKYHTAIKKASAFGYREGPQQHCYCSCNDLAETSTQNFFPNDTGCSIKALILLAPVFTMEPPFSLVILDTKNI